MGLALRLGRCLVCVQQAGNQQRNSQQNGAEHEPDSTGFRSSCVTPQGFAIWNAHLRLCSCPAPPAKISPSPPQSPEIRKPWPPPRPPEYRPQSTPWPARPAAAAPLRRPSGRSPSGVSLRSLNEPKEKYSSMPAAFSFAQPIRSTLPLVTPNQLSCRFQLRQQLRHRAAKLADAALRPAPQPPGTSAPSPPAAPARPSASHTPACSSARSRMIGSVLPCTGTPSSPTVRPYTFSHRDQKCLVVHPVARIQQGAVDVEQIRIECPPVEPSGQLRTSHRPIRHGSVCVPSFHFSSASSGTLQFAHLRPTMIRSMLRALPVALVALHQHGAEAHVVHGRLKARRKAGQKALQNLFFLHANHAVIRPGHPHVRLVGRSAWQHPRVRRRNMRMGPHHGRHPPVQIPPQRNLFAE